MKKFSDFDYVRPDFEITKTNSEILLDEFKNADSFEAQDKAMEKINKMRSEIDSMGSICHVRHSVNTLDEFYEKENDFFDEKGPLFEEINIKFYKLLIESKFRKELEEKWGKHLFDFAEMTIKSFSPEVIQDMQRENSLVSEYSKLVASAKIEFDGEERNLAQMRAYFQSTDRDVRKSAYEAYSKFFEENEDKFDSIYDKLVKIRTVIAKKLGYKNFIELGYMRLHRSDYNAEMVANYRKQIHEEVVPLTCKLLERQQKRLGLSAMKYYDEPLKFTSGNARPKGDPEWILKNGKKMYSELSPETDEFFSFMTDYELFDLLSKKGKMSGGYCTFIPKYKAPFIFSNFNGTSADIDVLTHEAGHAFQVYSSRNYEVPEYNWPTLEACEIHSMSMEFFTYPWMKNFFEEDEQKYKFAHLADALEFLPYGVSVDEFQHFVYENPEATPKERKAKWREIEKKYLPLRDYEDNDFYERGGMWFRQGHIFSMPFYYIDYTLAQVCAFQFWVKMNENREQAWEDYKRLCNAGGSDSFVNLVKLANLKNPFESGTVKSVVPFITEWLDSVDDSNF